MKSRLLARRLAAVAGGTAIVAMVGLTAACGGGTKAPETSTTTPTTSVSVTPTEKSINPTGGNLFTPTVKAPPPSNPVPGNHN
jgi:hypothetical protein